MPRWVPALSPRAARGSAVSTLRGLAPAASGLCAENAPGTQVCCATPSGRVIKCCPLLPILPCGPFLPCGPPQRRKEERKNRARVDRPRSLEAKTLWKGDRRRRTPGTRRRILWRSRRGTRRIPCRRPAEPRSRAGAHAHTQGKKRDDDHFCAQHGGLGYTHAQTKTTKLVPVRVGDGIRRHGDTATRRRNINVHDIGKTPINISMKCFHEIHFPAYARKRGYREAAPPARHRRHQGGASPAPPPPPTAPTAHQGGATRTLDLVRGRRPPRDRRSWQILYSVTK